MRRLACIAACAVLVLAGLAPGIRPAAAQPADTLLARVERALAAGQAEAAREAARTLAARHGRRAASHVALARALLSGAFPDARGAHRAASEALRRDPQSADALALRLSLERQGVGLGRLPLVLRRQQRADTARRLLRLDSTRTPDAARALAHLELGEQALDGFLFEDGRIEPVRVAPRGRPDESRFSLARFAGDGLVRRFDGEARRAADTARRHLASARHLAATSGDAATAAAAADALARLYARTGETTALLHLAFAERRRGGGADAAPWRWQGLALYASGQTAAAAAAFDSARTRLAPDLRADLDDLRRIARPADADRFTATPEAAGAFWDAADPRRLTPVNERRAEHDARLVLADLTLGEGPADARPDGRTEATPGRDTERGRVLVRYGPPVRRATITSRGRQADPQYAVFEVWEYERQRFVFAAVTREAPFELYTPPAAAFRSAPEQARADDYVQQHEDVTRRSPSETAYAPLARIPLAMQVAAFRADDARVDLVVAVGAPLSAAERDAWPGGRVGVALLRDGERVEAERQVQATMRPDSGLVAVGGGALWVHAESLRVRPGRYRLRAEADLIGGPVGFESLDLTAPVYERRFALSDVLLAHRVRPDTSAAPVPAGHVRRRGRLLLPAADAAFDRATPFFTYFEVYGLTARAGGATAFEVETTLSPESGTGERISTAFSVTGRAPTDAYAGRLDASALPPGRYRLHLRVRDAATGQTVETTRTLTLR